jgi:Raf kinase inhibitor-like YbhB/YbcL family protein
MKFNLRSPAFHHKGAIPAEHTCDGADRSPPLVWSHAPAETKSFALIVDDPDVPDPAAPRMTWVHWVVYNLAPKLPGLPAGASGTRLPAGAREGLNDWKQRGYRGPCPPIGRHRYFHKLYALDTVLPALHAPTKAALEAVMGGHVLAEAVLLGTYRKSRKRRA